MDIEIDFELFKKINMPQVFVYDIGNISERVLPEFMCDDPYKKIRSKIPKITFTESKDIENVLK